MALSTTLNSGEAGVELPTNACTQVQVIGDIRAYGTLNVDREGNVSDPHMDAEWDTYQDDEFHCRDCGEEFPNEEAAKEHLRRAQRNTNFWLMGLPEAKWRDTPLPDFNDESEEISIGGQTVPVRMGPACSLALAKSGYEGLIEQSVEVGTVPANFQFDDWEKLTDEASPLTYDGGGPRLSRRLLAKAVKHLATGAGATYSPERFTLYRNSDPEEPVVLVGNGSAILIAPRVQD